MKINELVQQTFVISLLEAIERREHTKKVLADLNLPFEFEDAVQSKTYFIGCAQSHLNVLNKITTFPTLVLEDDVEPFDDNKTIPPIPSDADIIYLKHFDISLRHNLPP